MRFGFIIGFLIGAGIASVISLAESEDAQANGDATDAGLLDRVRTQAQEAREEARKAAAEKEAEMQREWEALRHAKDQT